MNDDNRPGGSPLNGQDFRSNPQGGGQTNVAGAHYVPQQPVAEDSQHFFRQDMPQNPPVQYVAQSNESTQPLDVRMQDNSQGVTWTASEFIAHHKPPEWYLAVGILGVLIAAIAYFISHDFITVVTIIIVAVLFVLGGSRQPRQMQYGVNGHGITIGSHFYPYGSFRSFSVASEGPFRSIVLMPLKRFMPPLTMYFDPNDEDRIGEILTEFLPMQEHQEAATDRWMRKIRF